MSKISVIIPVYNTEKYIKKCLESVLGQTYNNIEVILVDDGSLDNSLEVINEFKDERIVLVKQENSGQASARNNAIKLAKGEYLTFIDSDDFVDIHLIEKLYKKIKETKADIAWCNLCRYEHDGGISKIEKEIANIQDEKIDYILNNSGPCAKLIKKDIICKNNLMFLEKHFYEDIAIVPSYALYADKVTCLDECLYFYRMHEGSTMKQVSYNNKMEDIFDSLKNLSNHFNDNYKDEIEYLYIEHLLHGASLRFFNFEEGKEQIDKIHKVIKEKYPKWYKNKYFIRKDIKYRIICKLFFDRQFLLLKMILK